MLFATENNQYEHSPQGEWVVLNTIRQDDELFEVTAASVHDGVGVMAKWTRIADKWSVSVWDTEMLCDTRSEDEGECVPPSPLTLTALAAAKGNSDDN